MTPRTDRKPLRMIVAIAAAVGAVGLSSACDEPVPEDNGDNNQQQQDDGYGGEGGDQGGNQGGEGGNQGGDQGGEDDQGEEDGG